MNISTYFFLNCRYSCVKAQFLSGNETKYKYHKDYYRHDDYWMVTKCHPNFSNTSVIQLCNNPGLDGSLESVLPVILVTTDEVYRNKFCVLCNKIELYNNIIYWNVDIYADKFLKFPQENLLTTVRSNRENIFFTPPKFIVKPQPCYIHAYTISTCNETGQWDQYDEDTELACNSFIDPYNRTYKNIFCYKCNQEKNFQNISKNAKCYEQIYENETPVFIASVDRDTVMGDNAIEKLKCGTEQFYDQKSVSR